MQARTASASSYAVCTDRSTRLVGGGGMLSPRERQPRAHSGQHCRCLHHSHMHNFHLTHNNGVLIYQSNHRGALLGSSFFFFQFAYALHVKKKGVRCIPDCDRVPHKVTARRNSTRKFGTFGASIPLWRPNLSMIDNFFCLLLS